MTTEPTPAEMPAASDAPAIKADEIDGIVLDLASDFQPALSLGGVQLKENGEPVFEFWKEQLRPVPLTDANGTNWPIGPKDIDDAVSDCHRAMLKGWNPPVQDKHYNPTRAFGKVVDVRKNKRGAMEWKTRFVGKKNADDALSLHSSLMLLPNFKDANGEKFRWFPLHTAAVFNPQDKYLQPYQPALAASGKQVNAVYLTLSESQSTGTAPEKAGSKMDLTQLRAYLGKTAEGKPDEEIPVLALSAMTETSQKLADQTEANQVLAGELSAAETARDEANSALALSAQEDDQQPSPQVLALSGKLAEMAIATALLPDPKLGNRPVITSNQATWLRAKAKASPALALSADATTLATPIDDFIEFARLGAGVVATPALKRGEIPAGVAPVVPLVLGGEEIPAPVTEERKKQLLAMSE